MPKEPETLGIWEEVTLILNQRSGAEAAQLEQLKRCMRTKKQRLTTTPKTDYSGCLCIM